MEQDTPATPTPFERAIAEAESFDYKSLFKQPDLREPVELVCRDCGRKHCHGHQS